MAPRADRRRPAHALSRRDGAHARLPRSGDRPARGVRRGLGPGRGAARPRHARRRGARAEPRRPQRSGRAHERPKLDEIARLRGPVGLYIGSKTPPEIALAILAEMTAVRHGVSEPSWAAKPERRYDPSACEVKTEVKT